MMADDDDHLNDCVDDDDDEMADAEMNCGRYAGAAGCSLAGTEWCDWNCPFSGELFARRRKPRPAPLLDMMNKQAKEKDPLAGRPGLRTVPAKGNKLARDLGELAKYHGLHGCVLISFKGERYGVNSSGVTRGFGPAMERLGNAILANIDDGKYDPDEELLTTEIQNSGRAIIEDGSLVIRVAISALPLVVEGAWAMTKMDTRYKITDAEQFAKDLVTALNAEEEDGTTRIHLMFDDAIEEAISQGAEGIEEHEDQQR